MDSYILPKGSKNCAHAVRAAERSQHWSRRQRSSYMGGHQLVIDGGSSLQMTVMADGMEIFTEVLADVGASEA
ncbi:hypothetical protein TELCIR_20593 [Teladorsagia circumcincta]|uniref:Uncharacterized protein n=1 Tax=Teladorsagia circumcincta TaxID=45464 RepID=A0A2G9TJ34_TELCI|nr:hypothetical protein TELCIR_20593 [Teladorsagia circumcincta]